MKNEKSQPDDAFDKAISDRLAKLRDMPVDVTRLRKRIEAQIPPVQSPNILRVAWRRPMRAIAASLLVVATIFAVIIASSAGPVLASPSRLAAIHEEVLTGNPHATPVESFESARAVLNQQWAGGPEVPEVPADQVMSCCVHKVGRKKMGCVTIKIDDVTVTVAIADAADVKMPSCPTRTIAGREFHVETHKGISMVMEERGGRWICLMGKLPVERLAEVAAKTKF